MENGIFLATASKFMKVNDRGTTTDRNGKQNIILNVIAGLAPDKRVLAGSIAENEGFIAGKTYLVSFAEGQRDDQYGRQFNFTKVAEASVMDTLECIKTLGKAIIVSTSDPKAPVEGTEEDLVDADAQAGN